jgi:hypothetical protein
VDGYAAISSRIAEIRGTLAALAPRPAATTTSSATFASVLATEVSSQATPAAGPVLAASSTPVAIDATNLPAQRIGAYGPQQLANAAAIINAGKAMGLSVRDQTIGVMTAIGESSLTVADHGDTAGPDSRGLFQQRANGAWGSLADRMNPTTSATSFFTALAGVKGRDAMAPTLVAHAVQRNADPQHYAKSWDAAVAIVTQLTGSGTAGR